MSEPDWLDQLRRIQEQMRSGGATFGLADAIAEAHDDERLRKIRELAEHGTTEGERAAARAALHRIEMAGEDDADQAARMLQNLQDEADYEDAAAFGEI